MGTTRKILTAAAGLGLAAGLVASASSAVAAEPAGDVTFWASEWFTGESATLPVTDDCTTLPFVAHAEYNAGSVGIDVYATPDCSGHALHFPANDIHSFVDFDGLSFRASR
ncbi:hypothetical protein [Isoptericola sp. NPDC056573]|uniref:hypothetical protein n=1 Tax=unclassified Isoptericola TaxID=2623355 RepID=UPI00368873C6